MIWGYVNQAVLKSGFQSLTLGFLTKSSRSLTWCLSRFWHFHISFRALKDIYPIVTNQSKLKSHVIQQSVVLYVWQTHTWQHLCPGWHTSSKDTSSFQWFPGCGEPCTGQKPVPPVACKHRGRYWWKHLNKMEIWTNSYLSITTPVACLIFLLIINYLCVNETTIPHWQFLTKYINGCLIIRFLIRQGSLSP